MPRNLRPAAVPDVPLGPSEGSLVGRSLDHLWLLGRAVEEPRRAGFPVSDDDVALFALTMTDRLNVHSCYHFDVAEAPKGSPSGAGFTLSHTRDESSTPGGNISSRSRWLRSRYMLVAGLRVLIRGPTHCIGLTAILKNKPREECD